MLSFKKVKISNSVKNGDATDTCNIASMPLSDEHGRILNTINFIILTRNIIKYAFVIKIL